MEPLLRETLADALAWLGREGCPGAVIGGLAVALRGQPRMTVDVDVMIAADVNHALGLVAGLEQSPFEPLFTGVDEVVRRAFILPLRHRRTKVRLDVAIGMSGFEQRALERAQLVTVGGLEVPVVAVEDLLVMKALAGRPQDEQDILGIVAVRGREIDWNECLTTARELGAAIDVDIAGRLVTLRAR